MLKQINKTDSDVTRYIQRVYRYDAQIRKLNHKQEILSVNRRKAESHTKFMLGGLIVKADLHIAFNIKLGDDLTNEHLEINVTALLGTLTNLLQELKNNNYHFDTLASNGARLLAYNSLTKYNIGKNNDVVQNIVKVSGSIPHEIANDEIHIADSQSKLVNRTIIQLGGIVVKSGLLEFFDLKLGDRLQHDYLIRKNVNALFGALINVSNN